MAKEETQAARMCGCLECRNMKADLAAGKPEAVAYGNCCANCGFYSPLGKIEASGVCCKFELSPANTGMNLYHRRRGELRGQALIVGGLFSCNSFRPVHKVLNAEAFWRGSPSVTEGSSGVP
jgi:hypothetical protein